MSLITKIKLPDGTVVANGIFYGTCTTAAGTAQKAVTCSEFASGDLVAGVVVFVKFSYTNTNANPTLKVNSTTAKTIKKQYNNAIVDLSDPGELIANSTYMFQYNGTYWILMNSDYGTVGGTIDLTWSEVKSLRDNSQLVPGAFYRITDYKATTSQAGTQSANHPFDIITLALSTNTLSEECQAAKHAGDGYFNACKVNAWRIWYRLDNDSGSFTWADTTNGKGVVYRMIDEYGNDLPYDFKGIQFKRYKIATVTNSAMANLVGLPIGTTNGYGYTVDTSVSKWYYTFSRMGNTWDDDVVDAGSFNSYTTDIVYDTMNMTDSNNNLPALMNNVFAYGPIVHEFLCNEEGVTPSYHPLTYFVRCHFEGTDSRDNTFIGWTGLVNARDTFRRNLIVGSFRHLDTGTNFQDNTFFNFNDCSFSYFGEGCSNNLLYSKITQNVDFGNMFRQNTITADCIYHSEFAGYVSRNTFTNIYFGSVKIKGQLLDCTFTGRFMACSFSPICGYCDFKGGTGNNYVVNLDVVGGIRGTASARINVENTTDFLATDAKGTQRRIRLEGDTNGNMVISWYSNGKHIIKTKGATGSTWTELSSGGIQSSNSTVTNIIQLTESAYAALSTKDSTTLYIVTPN